MNVTKEARENAVKAATNAHLGKTVVKIQDGCSSEEAGALLFAEHLEKHRNCPCCQGSVAKAVTVSKYIVSIMRGAEPFSEK